MTDESTMPSRLQVQSFTLGDWMTNCYVLHVEGHTGCWIIDTGFEPANMIRYIQSHGLVPEKIILTHAHVDHIAGLGQCHEQWPDAPILIHENEVDFLTDPALNLSVVLPDPIIVPQATDTLHHDQRLTLGTAAFQVRHTPGHSPGGITLYQPEAQVAIVGDALFASSVGRTDFPTSDPQLLIRSITEQLLSLPDETKVLPGHGPATTIGRERLTNPFLI